LSKIFEAFTYSFYACCLVLKKRKTFLKKVPDTNFGRTLKKPDDLFLVIDYYEPLFPHPRAPADPPSLRLCMGTGGYGPSPKFHVKMEWLMFPQYLKKHQKPKKIFCYLFFLPDKFKSAPKTCQTRSPPLPAPQPRSKSPPMSLHRTVSEDSVTCRECDNNLKRNIPRFSLGSTCAHPESG